MKLGLHVGIRRGALAALGRAEALGAEALQLLPYRRLPAQQPSPDGFRWEAPDPYDAGVFRERRPRGTVKRFVAHVRYLPFLASSDKLKRAASVNLLARELSFSELLGADEIVFHLGAYSPGADPRAGMKLFSEGAAEARKRSGGPPFVIENVPGGGRRMGGTLEELAAFRERMSAFGEPVRVCLDTAHAWAAGYDVATAAGMDAFLDRAAALFGAGDVTLFHLNDTRAARGSHREHHEHWGAGLLGTEGLRRLLARPDFSRATGILEMPPGRDRENLDFVRALR